MSFLDYYWKECSKRKVPLLLVRYEDLVLSPRDELQRILEFCCCGNNSQNNNNNNDGEDWWKRRLEEVTREEDEKDASESLSQGEKSGDLGGSFRYGYRSSASSSDPHGENPTPVAVTGSAVTENSDDTASSSATSHRARSSTRNSSTHPSIGRSLRKGLFPRELLQQIHDFDDLPNPRRKNDKDDRAGGWLERLGYHIYKQGFPNNLNNLPPVPVLDTTRCGGEDGSSRNGGSLTINARDVSLELRPRDSPYGRNMRRWRRKLTANDTIPFPTI
jgi:hypothetical protein